MKIAKVRIENFRSIREAEFEPEDLCGLIGPNNSGKSNVIRALSIILGDSWPSVRSINDGDFYGLSKDDDISITVWFDEKREVRGDVGDPVSFSGIQFRVTRYKRRSGRSEAGDLRAEFTCVDEAGDPVMIPKRPPSGSRPYQTPAHVTAEIREDLPAVVVDVDRNAKYHLSGSSRSVFGRLLEDVSRALSKNAAVSDRFKEQFEELQCTLHTDEFKELQANIENQLRKHTGLEDVGVRLDGLDPINIYKNFSVLFKDADSPAAVDAERMGTGVQSSMVVAMLQTYRELKRGNALLLFEEPELFLHPHGRRHLFSQLQALARSGVQIIYTTHSPDFVSLENIEAVRLVSKALARGTTVEPPKLECLEGKDWKKCAKHLRSPKNEMFFARSVVLVEGPTEELAIRHLAAMMPSPLDLDRLDCSVLAVESKTALPICIRLARALGKRVLAAYDTDSDKTTPQDIEINQSRQEDLEKACQEDGRLIKVDPFFEALAGLPNPRRNRKVDRIIEFLDGLEAWEDVSSGLKTLMESVAAFASHQGGVSIGGG
jgi:predicted ATP-dependent endonuclease of OLD family